MSGIGNILGVRMNLMLGPDPNPLPATIDMLEAFQSLEVTHSARHHSGFSLTFRIGRSSPLEWIESPLVSDPSLDVDARVIITMIFDIVPTVILDGIVTQRQVRPGGGSGDGLLTLMGRDLAWQLQKEVRQIDHPSLDEKAIATRIALSYPQYGLKPKVFEPRVVDRPTPVERTPQQRCSDWAYLNRMAQRHGFETYIDPGPEPGTNTLYWGPPVPEGAPQKVISVNQGPDSDAFDVDIDHSAEHLASVEAQVLDRQSGKLVPISAPTSLRQPLGQMPESERRRGRTLRRTIQTTGLTAMQAQARAQALVEESASRTVRVTGTLNTVRYNAPLKARQQVELRGVGHTFDGTYKVEEVRHSITPGSYTQKFTLSRNELGP